MERSGGRSREKKTTKILAQAREKTSQPVLHLRDWRGSEIASTVGSLYRPWWGTLVVQPAGEVGITDAARSA